MINTCLQRSYSELILIPNFIGRFEYLKLGGGFDDEKLDYSARFLKQQFYKTREWKRFRDDIILRDNGCDMALDGYDCRGRIYIHHLNPLTSDDIVKRRLEIILNPENAVCVSFSTHQAITFGDDRLLPSDPISRSPGDTTPWKNLLY